MSSKSRPGILMVIFGIIGGLYALITYNSERVSEDAFVAPYTQHELFVVLTGVLSIILVIIGIVCIALKKESSPPPTPVREETPYPKTAEKVHTYPVSPVKGPVSKPKLEGDLINRMRTESAVRSGVYAGASSEKHDYAKAGTSQKTLDEKYAVEHESWICPRCETINSNSSPICPVCGFTR